MKRLRLLTILLGVLMIAFAVPFIFLFGGVLMSLIGGSNNSGGISAVAGGFRISTTRIVIWIFILAVAVFAFGVAPRLFRRSN
jgi:hypothetical protein